MVFYSVERSIYLPLDQTHDIWSVSGFSCHNRDKWSTHVIWSIISQHHCHAIVRLCIYIGMDKSNGKQTENGLWPNNCLWLDFMRYAIFCWCIRFPSIWTVSMYISIVNDFIIMHCIADAVMAWQRRDHLWRVARAHTHKTHMLLWLRVTRNRQSDSTTHGSERWSVPFF